MCPVNERYLDWFFYRYCAQDVEKFYQLLYLRE